MTAQTISKQDRNTSAIRDAMLDWYDRHRRVLPWRSDPHVMPDPYHVWLSEIMLQQTTVQAVIPYFIKFIKQWPDIGALAAATQDDVLREWAGLGYYSRARNLHKCAQAVLAEYSGQFPQSISELKSLPGIGDYTAAAIMSIAFDAPATVIDGNVERVISRLYAIDTPLPDSKPLIREYAVPLFEGDNTDRPSCFAQSLMDLGATLCTPKSPKCPLCPIKSMCAAYQTGQADQYPFRKKKTPIPQKHAYVFIYLEPEQNQIFVVRRPEKGMLGGMVGFPTSEWIDLSDSLPETDGMIVKEKVKHVFTHFALTLTPVICTLDKSLDGVWIDCDAVDDAGLPTLFMKVWKLMKNQLDMV